MNKETEKFCETLGIEKNEFDSLVGFVADWMESENIQYGFGEQNSADIWILLNAATSVYFERWKELNK